MTHLVAFTGKAGSGKSTAATALVEAGFTRVRFAAPLKAMMHAYYTHCGLHGDEIDRRIEGDLKQSDDPLLGGATPRYAMQTLGTEWGREMIWDELWVNAWREKVKRLLDMGVNVVCEDCRFENEAETIRSLGGAIVRIEGRGGIAGDHESEKGVRDADTTVSNTGSFDLFVAGIVSTFGPEGSFWPAFDAMKVRRDISDDTYYEEIALRVLSCAHDVEQATEIIRQAIHEAQDLAVFAAADDEDEETGTGFLGLTEAEERVLNGMMEELAEATGRAVVLKTTQVSPHCTRQEHVELDVRPGITVDELAGLAKAFLGPNPDHKRLAQFGQMKAHIGSFYVSNYDQRSRTRLAFYIDAALAGSTATLSHLDCVLSAVIGGEQ